MTDLAKIEGSEIIIRVPIAALPTACEIAWDKALGMDANTFKINDLPAFAKEFVRELNSESETGETVIHLMLDKVAVDLLEDGADGLTWDGDGRKALPAREGMFRDHNCWKCGDGARPCIVGNPRQCEYPHARND